ncbi:MAG: pre-peptidase C-terminal domain-containing protein, partial [Acidobacteriota bacterium]
MPSTRMLRAVAAALAILLPGLAHAQCVADAYEPDDACIASPTVLRGSDRQAHDFCDDAEDWARFEACAGREYIIETDALGSAADTVLELFDRDCLTLLASDDDGGVGNASRLSWTAPSDGVYHVRVRQADGSLGEDRVYELLLDGDTTGCSAWAFSYVAMIDSYDQALFARQLHDGGMVFAGDGGAFDAFVARTDPDGELRSTTQLSSPGEEGASDVLEAPDGGLIVAGYRDDGSGHGSDLWLVKLDPAGESVWQRAYRTAYDEPAPGANYVRMRFTPTGELALISSGNHPDTLRDMVFMLVDSGDGSLLGQRRFGGDSIDSGYGIDVLPDGGFVLAGSTQSFSTTPVPDGWIVRLDADLNVLWQSVYGGPHHDEFRSVRATADGGFVAAGGADPDGSGLYDFWMVKLDAAGTIEWQ